MTGPRGHRTVLADVVVAVLVPPLLDALGTRDAGLRIVPAVVGALERGSGWIDLEAALQPADAVAAWGEATQAVLAELYSAAGVSDDPETFRRAVAGTWALRGLTGT